MSRRRSSTTACARSLLPASAKPVLGVVALSLWGSAHRLRITFFDFGVRCDALVATLVYLGAAIGAAAAAVFLLRI